MKALSTLFASLLVASLSTGDVLAQSSKSTAVVGDISYLAASTQEAGSAGWSTIMWNTIKTANQADLFIDVSLESGLFTRTLSRSKGGNKDTSTASATVRVRVLIDGIVAYPEEGIVFNSREQTLSATFQGILEGKNGESCLMVDLETGNVVIDEECLQPEEVELVLKTMSANSFNFIFADLRSGDHLIQVQAMIEIDSDSGQGEAEARATIGHGSITVEEVRMIKEEDL